ncbi:MULTISPECIES: hypothetical protein [unclassified Haloferax]|uniref:hypothetical protein n=1 Tax=Haloferax TaxID=2251 RepID=UPI0002B0EC23|nr:MULTISPECIES: hypothetical protein [unclassified Haloferax]ELZ54733.1 hypothetical protein C460_17368 [Haloferax sp. ATCC BAA-646]ELZ66184.1 hypothetical protein C459_04763 [Haloferax sp. ATCC BAA-645]
MADFTLFEVHLHDGFEFSPTNSAPLLSKGVDALTDADDESHDDYDAELDADETDESESSGGPGMALLVGFVLLVGIAAAVRYIRGDDDLDELADLDDDADERDEVEIDA